MTNGPDQNSMRVTLLYFASLREAVGTARESCELPTGIDTPRRLRGWLRERGEPWSAALAEGRSVRTAIDQVMAAPDTAFVDGAEIALFPPVTGG
ncbi:MAG: molybdopterin converting factor subunit 1 [Burkholderiaceae bacterium]